MGKYDGCIIQKIMFLRLHYYLLLLSIHQIYYAAQRCIKYLTQLLLIPIVMKMRWTILIGSYLVKPQTV